jgi:diketogulonate reductase-like aldo/keto reductase
MIRTEDDIIKAIERGERMIKTAHAFGKNQSEVFGHVRY